MVGNPLQRITYPVMWNRLLSIVEEQAQTLVRTAFSTVVREAGDLSAGIFDLEGRMLAQAITGTPGHINSMALSVRHFIDRFPVATMRQGDVYITNDPWKGTGHLHDFTVVTPTFRQGRVVALFACTCHVVDIGGIGQSPDGKEIYNEGLFVPIMPFATEGRINEWFMELVRANVREPTQVEGDLYALAACNETGGRRLIAMIDGYGLDSIDDLAAHIIDSSREAMIQAIKELPNGTYHNVMTIDGFDQPIELAAALTIGDEEILVDYTGTSSISNFGINCPMCYCEAYTAFGVKCVVAPELPNNAGTLERIKVTAPEGSILNAPHPCAVYSRTTVGQMLPDVVFGCLHQPLPDRVPAEGTSAIWSLKLGAGHGLTGTVNSQATPFNIMSFHSGGTGARPTMDGLSATPFPAGVRNVPIEVTEAITPIVFWKKEYRADSGGAGKFRGGLGQTMIVSNREDAPFGIFATFDRTLYAPRGRDGGKAGMLGKVHLESGQALKHKGFQIIPEKERLVLEMPGGGGHGSPLGRDPARVLEDVQNGLVTRAGAKSDYGVVITQDGRLDDEATARLRQTLMGKDET